MSRLIDADALIEEALTEGAYGYVDAKQIADAPTINAVEVVRCRDCKHLVLTSEGEHNPCDCVCDYWMTDGLKDNDFCSYGERKDGDD